MHLHCIIIIILLLYHIYICLNIIQKYCNYLKRAIQIISVNINKFDSICEKLRRVRMPIFIGLISKIENSDWSAFFKYYLYYINTIYFKYSDFFNLIFWFPDLLFLFILTGFEHMLYLTVSYHILDLF